jgi:hypothetical protein
MGVDGKTQVSKSRPGPPTYHFLAPLSFFSRRFHFSRAAFIFSRHFHFLAAFHVPAAFSFS